MKGKILIIFLFITGSVYGKWELTDSMHIPRGGHTLTVLQNGKVLCVGGKDKYNNYYASCEIFDPTTEKWEFTDSLRIARGFSTATLLNDGRVLIMGGRNDTAYFNSCEIYNPDSAKWTDLIENITFLGMYQHTSTLLQDGKVLTAGGGNHSAVCPVFDPATNTFKGTGILKQGRNGHTATLLPDGNVLVTGGGISITQTTATCEIYDTLTKQWSYAPSMHFIRFRHSAILLPDSSVFIYGGGDTTETSELYDSKTQIWTDIQDTLGSYKVGYGCVTLLSTNKVLIVGGLLKSTYKSTNNCELYNPVTKKFILTDSLHYGRIFGASVLLNDGRVLVAGGYEIPYEWSTSCEIYTYGPVIEENSKINPTIIECYCLPNPFVNSTTVKFNVVNRNDCSLQIYDLSGRVVKTLLNEEKPAGSYNIKLDAGDLKTGIYFVTLKTGTYQITQKLILLK